MFVRVLHLVALDLDFVCEAALQLVELDVGLYPAQKFGGAERLGDIVDCAQLEALYDFFGLALASEEDDGDVLGGGVGLEAAAGLEAIHDRHGDVEQNQVRWLCLRRLQSRLATRRQTHREVGCFQHSSQEVEIVGEVVDDENFNLIGIHVRSSTQ